MRTISHRRLRFRYKGSVVRTRQAGMRSRTIALAVAGAVLGALAIAPAGAVAAPVPNACTQTGGPGPAGETEWSCWADPSSVSGYEVEQTALGNIPKPPVDGHITHMETDVVDAATGTPVPINRLMLHHIVFFNTSRSDAACGGPERFYGAGEERAKISFPDGYGYPTTGSSGSDWFMVYMFMNHRAQTDDALIEYKVTVAPSSAGLTPLRSYWLDVGNCATDPIYNVPGLPQPLAAPKCKKVGKNAKPGARKKAAKCRKLAKQRNQQKAAMPTEATDTRIKDVKVKEDGVIVAGAGHVHGGAKKLTLTKPSCADLQVAESDPTWGNADHPFYNVQPVLHEPGPIGMSAFRSETGIPVNKNQTIRLNSLYDNLQPHTRVMGIFVVYVAEAAGTVSPAQECGGAPPDMIYGPGTNLPGRSTPVPFTVPLTGLDSGGNAIQIDGPAGLFKTLPSGASVTVGDRFFSEPNVKIAPGTTLTYNFAGNEAHNVTLANGPEGFGSENLTAGNTYSQTFTRAGTYRLFCAWHPVQMHERVVVQNPKKKKKKKKGKRKKR